MEQKFNGDDIDIDKLPKPSGWRMLVGRLKIEEKTTGGIILPEDLKKIKENNVAVVKILAVGDLAYDDNRFRGSNENAPIKRFGKVGDIVIIGRYTGQTIDCLNKSGNTETLKFCNDDEIIGTVTDINTIVI